MKLIGRTSNYAKKTALVGAMLALAMQPMELAARVGFAMRAVGACNERQYTGSLTAETEGDQVWMEKVGGVKVRNIPLMNPVSKAALRQIVRVEMHNLFNTLVDRSIWTITNPMTVRLTSDWDTQNVYTTKTFTFDPGDKGRSAAALLNFLRDKKANWRVVHSVFMAMYNYNLHLERMHGVVGMGSCETSTHVLEIKIDL